MWYCIFRNLSAVLLVATAAAPALGQAEKPGAPDEAKLIAVLTSKASVKDKADACRQLASVGTRNAVPALAMLLADERLAQMARYGLEPIPDPSVDDALRTALGQLKGRLLVGVIGSIGVRRDAKAIESLAQRLSDADPEVAQAAARSLGRISTPEAVRALTRALAVNPPAGNQAALDEALFRCAEALASRGARDEARDLYDLLRGGKRPPQVQAGALRGAILMRQKEQRLDLLRQQLRSAEYPLFAAAVRTAQEVKDPEVAELLVADLKQLPADRQALVIQAVACVADRCLQGKDAPEASRRLISPLQRAREVAATANLRQQTQALLDEARKSADKK
jgi:HEAT repeat protein